ncbi:Hypothetical predicted protein [Mytilus galloprovincialis]|uniref:Mab-21-like HhH/H2TH-like domain-containing protein n=1 Tax=Mytilus galloprovincialis TaxID=29158 RepID=A0A8B6H9X9_MYTGA|nr:Hypothetical predicted protein [Mytilus galloprovincialis]
MNGNAINQDNDDDESLFAMRKVTYWDIYGVKRFPYRGKRKFTPLLSQSLDGAMTISNDVFGLTIKRFERMYKACLDRRKTQEPWITNLRYLDKSANEYLEYLQNCTDYHLLWLGKDLRDKYLYEHLVETIGTEIEIRTRQRLFIIKDMISNAYPTQRPQISSGSLSEGLNLPGSDIDIMFVVPECEVVQNARNIKHPIKHSTCVLETDVDHPGFTRLIAVKTNDAKKCSQQQCNYCRCTDTSKKWYLSTNLFLDNIKNSFRNQQVIVHGPCIANKANTQDYAFCIYSRYLPNNAFQWAYRHRQQWPPNFVIDRVINNGCLIVPIGPKTTSDDDSLWRLSFSVQEKILVHSFNFTQLLCYGLLKLSLKHIVNTNHDVKELLCSYFLKTALFWVSEEQDINTFQLPKLFYCLSLCLNKLISWVHNCYCPNYFIPENNMFLGKINESNNTILLGVLESIQCGGISGLIMNLFPAENENHSLLSTKIGSSSTMLDFLFYGTIHVGTQENDILGNYKKLAFTESLVRSESSAFIIDVCKFYHAHISQNIVQLLPPPNTKSGKYAIRTCYHKHLQCGTKTDAVSGWLLYASFYYVTGQFHVVLSLTDFVLSRCSPDMVFQCDEPSCGHRIMYSQNVHSSITLNKRMKMAIIRNVRYCKNSSLIPKELQLEDEKDRIDIPPVIMSYCLRFLCYHHLGDIFNRQQSLRDLFSTVKRKYLIETSELSDSITILGVCYEISGDKDRAYQCYEEALQVDDTISKTAKIRKSKLLL